VLFVKQVLERDEALQYLRVCNECPVFLGALDSLKKEELQEKAIDLITQVISLIPKDLTDLILFTQSPEMAMLNAIVQRIIESAFLTFPQCRIAIQDELSDEVEQYVTFYSKIGKRFIHQILQLPQLTLPFLEMMLLLLQSNESDDRIVTLKLFWDKLFKTIEVYQARDNRPIELGSVWKVLAVTCFKKCVVSVKYLLHYAAERKEKTVEEDLEDGELSDPEDIDNANEEYETKLDVRKQVREIILAMVAATDPKVLVLLLKEEVKNFAPLFTPENLALEFKDLPPIAQQ
jgi:transportin-3